MDLKTVKVGGITYTIKVVKNLEDEGEALWGLTKYEDAAIQIREELTEQKKRQTLAHEMVHAMLHEAGLDDMASNEKLVNPFGIMFNQVLLDNPELLALYKGDLNE